VDDSSAVFDAIRAICADDAHPLKRAVLGSADGALALADAVANLRPAETLAGQLDGNGIASVALALLLLESDQDALAAREAAALVEPTSWTWCAKTRTPTRSPATRTPCSWRCSPT